MNIFALCYIDFQGEEKIIDYFMEYENAITELNKYRDNNPGLELSIVDIKVK